MGVALVACPPVRGSRGNALAGKPPVPPDPSLVQKVRGRPVPRAAAGRYNRSMDPQDDAPEPTPAQPCSAKPATQGEAERPESEGRLRMTRRRWLATGAGLEAAGCGAALAGHTHGGQVQAPLIGPLLLPVRHRERYEGLHQVGGLWLYINRGLGWLLRVRFACRPEITVHTLQSCAAGAPRLRSGQAPTRRAELV